MQAFSKLLYAFTLLGMTLSAAALPKLQKRLVPACDLSGDDILNVIPADMFDSSNPRPLLYPIDDHPVFTVLGVGYANYTCTSAGTWSAIGGAVQLFDISCTPWDQRQSVTEDAYTTWVNQPDAHTFPGMVAAMGPDWADYAWGQHYWVADPNDPTDGSVNPYWDFASTEYNDVLATEPDHDKAYLIGYRTGIVPAPEDPSQNIEWVSLDAYKDANGNPYGSFAIQTYRIFTYGGVGPTGSCTPGDLSTVKTTLNFWYYGGAWA